jgi:hypothetical protein
MTEEELKLSGELANISNVNYAYLFLMKSLVYNALGSCGENPSKNVSSLARTNADNSSSYAPYR